ncbi:hypothetical protein [Specibacter sp. NPDC078692]|uniref:hypothetical protein n=1 Tax=Specibacter sp. NPDC078692 TaxID=3155818 RepID=UPI00344523B1
MPHDFAAPDVDQYRASILVQAVTATSIKLATGLDWIKVTNSVQIPSKSGVYMHVDSTTDCMVYNGRGVGKAGLKGRLSNQRRWIQEHLTRLETATTFEDHFFVAREVPAVRTPAEKNLDLWVAVSGPATWNVPLNEGDYLPETGEQWESFMYAWSHLITGSRSLIGGGAWESKPGTTGDVMERVAWSRLCDLELQAKHHLLI